jgi:alpha-beta hydrolase superfamily lysophospholipase
MLTPGLYVLPDYSLLEKVQIAASGVLRPQRRFRVPQNDDLFSHDPELLAWIHADSLGAKTVTAHCLLQTNAMLRTLRRRAGELPVPVFVLEASRDRISDNARNRALLHRTFGERVTFVTFDAEHFLLGEPVRDNVLATLTEWVTSTGTA